MSSDSFRLHLPDHPPTNLIIAEFSLKRSTDCTAAVRRAKVLGSLVELRQRDRNAFGRAVGEVSKSVLSSSGSGSVRFGLCESSGTRCVKAEIVGDIERNEEQGDGNGCDYARRFSDDFDESRVRKLAAGSAFFESDEDSPRLSFGWALPNSLRLPTKAELDQWKQILRAGSFEESIAITNRTNRQLQSELGRRRSRQPAEIDENGQNLAMLSLVVSKATNAISIMSADGIIEWVNDAFSRMTGYSEGEAVGRRLDELLFGPSTASKSVREFHQALRNGHDLSQDVLQYNRDGRTFWAECNLIGVHDDNGELRRWIAIDSDITERHRTEEALRAAKKSAESTSRAKSEFLANMSHEIRTPLNAILGMTELALTTRLSPEQNDYLQTVQASAQTLLQLLNDILDVSKIEAGKLAIEEIEFNLADIVRDTLKALSVKAHEKNLELVSNVPLDMPQQVVGDPVRLRQVLFNLVGNAIKFTNAGEVVVSVEEQWRSDGKLGIHVSVEDTGIGIPSDRLQSIFDSFTQVDSSMARKFGGTGLGLTITSQLLSLMNGRIWVRSEEGKGSIFHFSLPLKLSEPASLGRSRDATLLAGKSALIVDDNETNRRILNDMLRHWDMRTTLADGAAVALKELENASRDDSPFDIILLDGMMPVVDGFQLAGMIKQRPDLKCGTIMMLSSADQTQSAEKCEELQITNYLVKPVSAAALLDAILVALRNEVPGQQKHQTEASKVDASNDQLPSTPSRSLRVLVVDDHEANRDLARKILERRGHSCEEVIDGQEAVEAVATSKFDLVLMDVQMPKLDGFQATSKIREHEDSAGDRLPIVALTAHAMSGDREKCLAAGMDSYLAKPIDARELVAVVERLGGVAAASEARSSQDGNRPTCENGEDFDFGPALRRLNGEVDLLLDVMSYFQKDASELVTGIKSAITNADGPSLQSAAHRLKSLIGSYHHDRGVELALKLEHLGRDAEFDQASQSDAERSVDELQSIVNCLQRAIEVYRRQNAEHAM